VPAGEKTGTGGHKYRWLPAPSDPASATVRPTLSRARLVWRGLQAYLGRYPSIYLPLARRLYGTDDEGGPLAVSPETELVIEGYPRSGNTFAVVAIRMAQPTSICIAHHLHAPAQVVAGVRRGLPVMVLIRDPREATASLVIRHSWLSLERALREYISFYGRLSPHKAGFLVVRFQDLVTDYGAVIRDLNSRFGTHFAEFEHTSENVARCYSLIERIQLASPSASGRIVEAAIARPSAHRRPEKERVLQRFSKAPIANLLREANNIYAAIVQEEHAA
jgi:hypothetical protein